MKRRHYWQIDLQEPQKETLPTQGGDVRSQPKSTRRKEALKNSEETRKRIETKDACCNLHEVEVQERPKYCERCQNNSYLGWARGKC